MRGSGTRLRRAVVAALVAVAAAVAGLPAAPASAAGSASAANEPALHVQVMESCAFLLRGETTLLRVGVLNMTGQDLGPVSLAAGLPAGFTAEIGPAPAPLMHGAERTFRVRVTVPAAAPAGDATLRFTAASGQVTGTLSLTRPVVGAPAAPSAVVATARDGAAAVTWTAGPPPGLPPAPDGADWRPVFVVTASPGGARTSVRGATGATVAGLANGTAYTFTVTEINGFGSTASAPSAPVVPVGVPGVVPDVTAAGTGTSRVVSWGVPETNGAPLTGYTVTAHPGGATVAAGPDATSAEVTGLDESAAYAFTVRATNAAGTGPDSPLPDGRPTALGATVTLDPAGGSAFIEGVAAGGPAPTGWLVRYEPSGVEVLAERMEHETYPHGFGWADDAWQLPGTTVAATVRPVNAAGAGPATRVAPVTTAAHEPEPPAVHGAVPGDGVVQVCFAAGYDAGAAVREFTAYADGTPTTLPLSARLATLPAENWRALPFNVYATGDFGEVGGAEGLWAEPQGTAPAPEVTAEPHDRTVRLTWDYDHHAPSSGGGYLEIVASPGGRTQYVPKSVQVTWFDGVTNGTAYTFTVRAVDQNGYGPAAVTEAVVPGHAPPPVTDVTVTALPGDPSAAVVRWTAADPSGGPVTRYDVLRDDTTAAQVPGDVTSVTVRGLADGVYHYFGVTATNAVGTSELSPLAVYRPVAVDTTPPLVAVTRPPAVTTSGTARVMYTATDAVTYDVRYRAVRHDGTAGAYRYPASWQETRATTHGVTARPGTAYCFGVRGRDKARNVSGWSPDVCTAAPADDRALAAGPGWRSGSHPAFYEGTYRSAGAGAALSLPGVRGRRLALVAAACAACGEVGVYLDGALLRRVSLTSPTTAYRKVVEVDFGGVRSGTVTLRVRSGRAYVDGLAVLPA